jgi:uncharacterized repeat protein (TIGR03803 family)
LHELEQFLPQSHNRQWTHLVKETVMSSPAQLSKPVLRNCFRRAAVALTLLNALTIAATLSAQTETFSVLHTFTGGTDGAQPYGGLTVGGTETFYGTASQGGIPGSCSGFGCGVAFKLSHSGSGWTLSPLHEFTGSPNDGLRPMGNLTIGPNGALYGVTYDGGNGSCPYGCGTVFELRPPATECRTAICYWNETVLYSFQGGANDGENPDGDLIFDQAGNIYGATEFGGNEGCYLGGCGTIFKLTPSDHGLWTETIVHSFTNNGSDGNEPAGGVIFDAAGNLYGTTQSGGTSQECYEGCGTIFELTPSGQTWTESILYNFNLYVDGGSPGQLTIDPSGKLYGTTYDGGGGGGSIFELTQVNGSWNFSVLALFSRCSSDGGLTLDGAGNLYGTCSVGGINGDSGMVFELKNHDGQWSLLDIYDFTGESDGGEPGAGVVFDGNFNLYGTALIGGNRSNCMDGCGTVWKITP